MKRWVAAALTILGVLAGFALVYAAPLQPTADFQWTEGLAPVGTPATLASGDTFSLQLFIRTACTGSGHNSGTARLWYGDASANSNAFLAATGTMNYLFLNTSTTLATSTGSTRQTVDVQAGAKCSAYKSMGTWQMSF